MGRKAVDMTGVRVGQLTVEARYDLNNGGARWLCRCDCGGTAIVQGTHLRGGRTLSCGCLRGCKGGIRKAPAPKAAPKPRGHFAEDITGQRFGRYVVLSKVETRGRRAFWLCRCDCGTEKEVMGQHLRLGRVVSCGCFNRELVTATLVASNYKGDEITYYTAHDRVKVARGPACSHLCVACGNQAEDWALRRDASKMRFGHAGRYTMAFSPDPQDYDPRCKPCHAEYDRDGRRSRADADPGLDDAQDMDSAAG